MIRLRNHSTSPFRGWVRTTTDAELTGPVHFGAHEIVPARRIGLDVHAVDVWVTLDPNEAKDIDLAQTHPSNWTLTQAPADIKAHFGGDPLCNGAPMLLAGIAQDGAAWLAHYRWRFGQMFLVDLWLRWYPDQPAVVEAECMVSCSNADVPDMGEVLPDFRLTWGDSWMFGAVPKAGMRFADGQARAFPLTFVWQRHLHTPLDWSTASAIVYHQIGAVGVSKLLPHGNPTLPADFNLPKWAAEHWNRSIDILTTWEHPQLGPAADTGQTGAVEDQCFVGGECFYKGETLEAGGTGAEWVDYFAALATSGHPMHHYERDGTVVDKDRRPGLRMFYSRPHSSGSDRLNKGRDLSVEEASGWNGPDAQHWTINRLAAAARLKDSPACQRLLECHARNYLVQLTTTPGWSTSAIWSAREIGWEGIAAVHLYRCLEDRGLAERVKAHWRERVRNVIEPFIGGRRVWDVRKDDARLGSGDWWMPWQQSLGVYGLDLACELFDLPVGRAMALAGAYEILGEAWTREGNRMVEYELLALDGRRSRSGYFATAWLPLAVATVLRHEPGNALAREVRQQIVADANGNGRWLDPGVLLTR